MNLDNALAVVCAEPGRVTISDLGHAPLGETDVLIRSSFSGVSTGTDKWVMQGRFHWDGLSFPLSPGYQRSGVVEAVGAAVTKFTVGQFVAATTSVGLVGASSQWGSHTALAASPESEVHDATAVDPIAASLFVSAQVGFNAASRITSIAGSRVAVIGGGIIGSSAALAAKARGYDVMVVDHHDNHLEVLAGLSLATMNNTRETQPLIEWRPVAVIDTAQNDEAFDLYADLLPARFGEVVFSGHSPDGIKQWGDMTRLQQRELTAHFVSGWTTERLTSTLQLMRAGRLPIRELVGTIAHDEESAIELMSTVGTGALRPIAAAIDWSAIQGPPSHPSQSESPTI